MRVIATVAMFAVALGASAFAQETTIKVPQGSGVFPTVGQVNCLEELGSGRLCAATYACSGESGQLWGDLANKRWAASYRRRFPSGTGARLRDHRRWQGCGAVVHGLQPARPRQRACGVGHASIDHTSRSGKRTLDRYLHPIVAA